MVRAKLPASTRNAVHREATLPNEEFLYHLYRGSEMLLDNRVHEAKDELERALRLQPKDFKGQDLMAAVYYRLGRFDRCIEIYRTLIAEHPREATLRVNMALAQMKLDRLPEALDELKAAVRLRPEDQRAHNYMGLLYVKLGELGRAREAFEKSGQTLVAERLDQVEKGLLSRSVLSDPVQLVREARRAGDVRGVARAAFAELESGDNPFSLAAGRDTVPSVPAPDGSSAWRAVEPASRTAEPGVGAGGRRAATPAAPAPTADPRALGARPGEDLAAAGALRFPLEASGPVAVDARGVLFVRLDGTVRCRLSGLLLVVGDLVTEPTLRRSKGRTTDEPVGDLVRVSGGSWLAIDPAGARFSILAVAEEPIYLREEVVFAFDDGLNWENGRVAAPSGSAIPLVHFRGRGSIVLRTTAEPRALAVRAEQSIAVPQTKLVGWIGRLLPRTAESPSTAVSDLCGLSGDGTVLVAG